jgi:RNA polymerase sigma-70 factor (ECF subfamily)
MGFRGISGIEWVVSASYEPRAPVTDERFLEETLGAMDLVYNIARRVAPRRDDAEDLVQETYLRAFRAWRDGRRPDRVEPWLATICLNLARSEHRRRLRHPIDIDLATIESASGSLDTDAMALAELDREAVHRSLWSLPEEQRVAIALVDLAGLSTAEAARAMRTPKGTVLSRLHRGRRSLALLVEPQVREREP